MLILCKCLLYQKKKEIDKFMREKTMDSVSVNNIQ